MDIYTSATRALISTSAARNLPHSTTESSSHRARFPSSVTESLNLSKRRGVWTGSAAIQSATTLGLARPSFRERVLDNARFLGKWPFWDHSSLRGTVPSARFGNLLIFRGTCACGSILAPGFYFDALPKIYAEKPDWGAAERLLRQSLAFDPSPFFVHIQLGNVHLKRGSRGNALQAYSEALQRAPNNPRIRRSIEEQIKRVSSEPLRQVPELRDPFME